MYALCVCTHMCVWGGLMLVLVRAVVMYSITGSAGSSLLP